MAQAHVHVTQRLGNMQHATCKMRHAAQYMQHATCKMQHAAQYMQHATCKMRHAAHCMQHAAEDRSSGVVHAVHVAVVCCTLRLSVARCGCLLHVAVVCYTLRLSVARCGGPLRCSCLQVPAERHGRAAQRWLRAEDRRVVRLLPPAPTTRAEPALPAAVPAAPTMPSGIPSTGGGAGSGRSTPSATLRVFPTVAGYPNCMASQQ